MKKTMLALMVTAFVMVCVGMSHAQCTTQTMGPDIPFYGTDTARTYEGFVTMNGVDTQWGPIIVVDTKDKGSQKFFVNNKAEFHPSAIMIRDGIYVIVKSDEFNHLKYCEVLPFVEWQNRTGWKK
jgi:hypothetical protein